MQVRSFDGGRTFERPRILAQLTECGLPDPDTGRLSFDGIAGARTDSYPSVDIANGAPGGADATNEIVLTYCNGPTDHGQTLASAGSASPLTDRPDFPAIAISPNGTDVYATYTNYLQPWQSSALAPARLAQGVVLHASASVRTGLSRAGTNRKARPPGRTTASLRRGASRRHIGRCRRSLIPGAGSRRCRGRP